MRKIICFVISIFLILILSGCSACDTSDELSVLAVISETPWVKTINNGISVLPGEDAVFRLSVSEGFTVTGTDYHGDAIIEPDGDTVLLTLRNVLYPVRVSLNLSNDCFVLRYDPNGGTGEAFTVLQEKKYHLRPNTANANVPFSREGYTLIGWNTEPDGSGVSAGLGSRVTVDEAGITLYAQWLPWTDPSFFTVKQENAEAVITGCSFTGETLVIPGRIDGTPVTRLADGAFSGYRFDSVVFPENLRSAEPGCFSGSEVSHLYLFDSIEEISDSCFSEDGLTTLHINAVEAPAGAAVYKESCYADKLDQLILTGGENRIVFYGGCSMWYNLDINRLLPVLRDDWRPVNLALNGTVNSDLQMQILLPYLHDGDLFFHTPELSSDMQMLRTTQMGSNADRLWAGIEYNYDLLASADLRTVTGELDSLCKYLSGKKDETSYEDRYLDSRKRAYCGAYGEIPFSRYEPEGPLGDTVLLNAALISEEGTQRLGAWYARLQERGVRVFVSYACLNLDALTEEERGNVHEVDDAFREAVEHMPGVTLLSDLMHFTYHNGDFFDTNYHLLSDAASGCTNVWIKALKPWLSEVS